MKGQPSRTKNGERRSRLLAGLAPAVSTIPCGEIRQAPYGITCDLSVAHTDALINRAIEVRGPPGALIGRQIRTTTGHTVEILVGWEFLAAFRHQDAYPNADHVPVAVLECNDSEAAFYAIEYAYQMHLAAGWDTSPLLYAAAAQRALTHFSETGDRWHIQTLANALSIHRTTLSHRLRLLKGLYPRTMALLQTGALKPQFAKILLAERDGERQERLAQQVVKGMMSTRALYQLVHPDYEPPARVPRKKPSNSRDSADLNRMARTLSERYGTAVSIAVSQRSGTIGLPFHSLSALKGLLDALDERTKTDTLMSGNLILQTSSDTQTTALLQELGAREDDE